MAGGLLAGGFEMLVSWNFTESPSSSEPVSSSSEELGCVRSEVSGSALEEPGTRSPGVLASVALSTGLGIRRGSCAALGTDGVTIGSPEAVPAGAGVEEGLISAGVMLSSS
eukprot:scaffold70166_cov59-Attheya_sp.AAC.14